MRTHNGSLPSSENLVLSSFGSTVRFTVQMRRATPSTRKPLSLLSQLYCGKGSSGTSRRSSHGAAAPQAGAEQYGSSDEMM